MGVFDLPADFGVQFTSSRDAFFPQFFTIERRPALSGEPFEKLGPDYNAGASPYFGPLPIPYVYRVSGYWSNAKGEGRNPSKESQQDDGATVVYRYEDGTDNDFNDLIVVGARQSPSPTPVQLDQLQKLDPGWTSIDLAEGFGAFRR